MGCPIESMPWRVGDNQHIESLEANERVACWPLVLENPIVRSQATYKWLENSPRNCIVGAPWYASQCLAITGGWWRFGELSDLPTLSQHLLVAVARMVPNFLQYMAKQHMRRSLRYTTNTLEAIGADTLAWFSSLNGQPTTIKKAIASIKTDSPKARADAFWELLFHFYDDNMFVYNPQSGYKTFRGQRHGWPTIVEMDEGVWVPRAAMNQLLSHKGGFLGVLDTASATDALHEIGELLKCYDHQGVPGWLFSYEVWKRRRESQNPTTLYNEEAK
jgi:hypothetical protein